VGPQLVYGAAGYSAGRPASRIAAAISAVRRTRVPSCRGPGSGFQERSTGRKRDQGTGPWLVTGQQRLAVRPEEGVQGEDEDEDGDGWRRAKGEGRRCTGLLTYLFLVWSSVITLKTRLGALCTPTAAAATTLLACRCCMLLPPPRAATSSGCGACAQSRVWLRVRCCSRPASVSCRSSRRLKLELLLSRGWLLRVARVDWSGSAALEQRSAVCPPSTPRPID
jgi:hypothetical protein